MVADHVHQQHRANVEAWREHVLQWIAHIDQLVAAGDIANARGALYQLAKNIHEAQN